MFQRQPRTRADLNFITSRDRDRKAGRERMARTRRERQRFGGNHVHPGGTRCRIGGEGEVVAMGKAQEGDGNGGHMLCNYPSAIEPLWTTSKPNSVTLLAASAA